MTYVDPGSLFDNLQRINEGEADHEDDLVDPLSLGLPLPKDLASISTAFFGEAHSFGTDESVSKFSNDFNTPTTKNLIKTPSCEPATAAPPLYYTATILGVPESGARSRTETQVRFVLRVLPHDSHVPPLKELWLPPNLLSDELKAITNHHHHHINMAESNESMALIRARVFYSDRDEPVYSCYSCILRERKRIMRKRAKSITTTASTINSLDDGKLDECCPDEINKATEQDRERILVFASASTKISLLRGEVMLPVRLTCYCRHQDEKVGYRVCIELYNSLHQLIGKAISPPILITDDHKRLSRQQKDALPLSPSPPNSGINLLQMDNSLGKDQMFQEDNLLAKYLSNDPQIFKVVPSEGPMHGGIEITILGENLAPDTVVMFGSLPSNIVTFISSTTMVVRLPPSHVAGLVPVTIINQDISKLNPEEYVFFSYKNDLDRTMMELALQLIGMKMTGRVDDARDIAIRIISEFNPVLASNSTTTVESGGTSLKNNSFNNSGRLEQVLITCLAAAEATGGIKFSIEDLLNCTTEGEHTLLHLAALARFDYLFEYLANTGGRSLMTAQDLNGLTPPDLYFLSGRQAKLESMGLDDSSDDDNDDENCSSLDFYDRYQIIRRRTLERLRGHRTTVLETFVTGLNRIRKRPSRIKNHFKRVRNLLWRKFTSEANIKNYYLQSFGADKVQDMGSRIYRNYQEMKPVNFRVRDAIVWYCWVPILMAVILVWYFDFAPSFSPTTALLI